MHIKQTSNYSLNRCSLSRDWLALALLSGLSLLLHDLAIIGDALRKDVVQFLVHGDLGVLQLGQSVDH